MDYHALQRKLFEMDPSDPREDLKKLQQAARGPVDIAPTKDYLNESVAVSKGSLPLELDNIADFAKLAGVTINEGKQKAADKVRGNEPKPEAEPGRTKHPFKDRLVGEGPLDQIQKGVRDYDPSALEKGIKKVFTGDPSKDKDKEKTVKTTTSSTASSTLHPKLQSKLEPFKYALEKIFTSERELKREFIELMKKADPSLRVNKEGIEEADKMKVQAPKQRDPNWRTMLAKRTSGAGGMHKDKKHDMKMGKEKHKKDYATESIKDRLWAALNKDDV
jgi:hypothetical protein